MHDLTFQNGPIYTHPNIRQLTAEELHNRLDVIRNRRLITAIEFQSAQAKRLDKEGDKLSEKWSKLRDRVSTRIAKATEEIEKAEKELQQLTAISNQLFILEGK